MVSGPTWYDAERGVLVPLGAHWDEELWKYVDEAGEVVEVGYGSFSTDVLGGSLMAIAPYVALGTLSGTPLSIQSMTPLQKTLINTVKALAETGVAVYAGDFVAKTWFSKDGKYEYSRYPKSGFKPSKFPDKYGNKCYYKLGGEGSAVPQARESAAVVYPPLVESTDEYGTRTVTQDGALVEVGNLGLGYKFVVGVGYVPY